MAHVPTIRPSRAGAHALLLALALSVPHLAAADDGPRLRLSTGFDYSSGDYGSDATTKILYVPITARYETGSALLKVTVPYLSIESDNCVATGGGEVICGGSTGTSNTESGLGDVTFSATYYLLPETTNRPSVDLTGKIKLPTADEDKGLGTGEPDYSIEAELTKISGSNAVFGSLGYKVFGDPVDYDINDVLFLSVGLAHQVRSGLSVGLLYDVREATIDGRDGMNELTPYFSRRVGDRYKVLGYSVIGLSDGSADWGIGLQLSRDTEFSEIRRYLPGFLKP
jgi:hypothetical protein